MHQTAQTHQTTQRWRRLRAWLVVLCAFGLSACSVVSLLYQQSPRWTAQWVNQQVRLTDAQRDELDVALEGVLRWHQAQVLPDWVRMLRHWAERSTQNWTPDEVCATGERLRASLHATVTHSLPLWTRLSLDLTASQRKHLSQARAKALAEFRADYVDAQPEQVLSRRLERATDQWERFYGDLSDAQIQTLRQWLNESRWSPAQAAARRQAGNAELMTLLNTSASAPQRQHQLANWVAQQWSPSTDTLRAAPSDEWQHMCRMVADMHRRMSPQQREHLRLELQGYAKDLAALLD